MAIENQASTLEESTSTSLFSNFVSFFVPTAHAEAPEESEEPAEEGSDEPEEKEEEEEEEEEEPEDPAPAIREECEQKTCAEHVHHFKHCQEKVEAGKGFPGEDCVEEFFHVLHCVDQCAAPKIFKKLA
ncbi:uncharacterized protein I206_107172 [Kwoniella pini CBS 10737]|uniref:Ubiquinol-cytochrome c reductase subunit 6 n=1 Tax=Kwoniella pini CBS 10737 TaxID=1296096 RepID=A0A1B9HYZ0_9TREE|nr:ubiquinol-cytochrome c reductase subunit 6 [Kwoniella pini CBS 10737]OCF48503.1 ubiquinol-cytochrome c reductase subunit 6 [Kwoniella pini CBS 10737]